MNCKKNMKTYINMKGNAYIRFCLNIGPLFRDLLECIKLTIQTISF